nr:integrase, catalytic region, zinc finger, CCHC-type, peptidase aspartic, catalytic [Tanacetum cinerariifolium]
MPEDIKVPLILEIPFLSTARAKIDVYKRKITLRVGEERIIFTRRNQGDDLMPTIEEGEVIEEFRTRDDELNDGIDDYLSYCDYDKKIHIDFLENIDAYRDEGMSDVIFGEPFLREVRIKTRWFEGMITIYHGDDEGRLCQFQNLVVFCLKTWLRFVSKTSYVLSQDLLRFVSRLGCVLSQDLLRFVSRLTAFCLKTLLRFVLRLGFILSQDLMRFVSRLTAFCLKIVAFCLHASCVLSTFEDLFCVFVEGNSVQEPLAEGTEGAPHLGPKRPRVYSDLSPKEKDWYNANIRATNILLQGLPKDIYTLINHYTDAKDIWDNIKMLLEGSELTKEDQESQLYDDFKHFRQHKGETIHDYYAQENGVTLDTKQLLFLAGGQDNAFDDDMDEQPVQDLELNVDNVFQANDCDAFDSDVDEAPTAQTMFMANLLFADPVTDEAGPSYDSNILSEVQDHDHYQDAVCAHHEEHAMHDNIQLNHVVDSHADYMSDSNMILYDQYVKDNAVPVVHSNVSSVPNDAFIMLYNDMYEPHAQSVSNTSRFIVVKNSLTAELATYKEQVELYERRAKFKLAEREQKINEQLRLVIFDQLEAELANLRDKSHHDNQEELINHFSKLELQETRSDTDRTLKVRTTDSQITQLTEQVTNLQAQNDLFRTENDKIKQHYKELYDSIKITRAKHIEHVTALTTENVNLKTQILEKVNSVSKDHVKPKVLAQGKYAIDVEPIVPRFRNNRDAHLDYLRHLKESVVLNIRFSPKTQRSGGRGGLKRKVKCCTNASGSHPRSNTKKNRISPVEEQSRSNKSLLRTSDRVDSSSRIKRTVVQIVLWYLDSGCSKHMTWDRSWLINFMKKFIETVRFRNDNFGAIMGYGDYVIGDSVISRVYYVEGLRHNLFSVGPVSPAQAVQAPVNSAGTPSSTTIDQDAPSLSISPSSSALQSYQGVPAEPTYMEDHHVAPIDNNPFVNVFALKPNSEASSFEDISLT